MGRDIAFQLATHQKAVAAAKIAARNNALKRRGNSNKVSKVRVMLLYDKSYSCTNTHINTNLDFTEKVNVNID